MLSPAAQHLRKSGLTLVGVYFVVYFVTFYLSIRLQPTGSALWALAALPLLPILGVIVLMGRYLRTERDEYKREMVIRCLLWSTAGCVSVNLFAGFIRIFGGEGRFPPFTEFFVFAVCMLVAKLTYRMKDRVPVE